MVRAGRTVFLRYGFARTTMEDLARAAGISRPSLYLLFPGKEELFEAVIDELWQETLRVYEAKLPKLKTMEQRLRFCLQYWTGMGYDLTTAHPDAADAFNTKHPAVRRMYDALAAYLGELISDAVKQSKLRIAPNDLAAAAVFSLRGMKELAGSREHMTRLIDLQVDLLLAALG